MEKQLASMIFLPNLIAKIHLSLFKLIWSTDSVPKEWKESTIVKVPKKGDLKVCSNWRGIALTPAICKIFNKVILKRILEPLDQCLRKEQAGFRPNRSCIDQINSIRLIIEQCNELNTCLYLTFIDFEKAFDAIDRTKIWRVLENKGVPTKIISLIKAQYADSTMRVSHLGKISDSFKTHSGVKQGCLLSPLLFITTLDEILAYSNSQNKGIQWRISQHLEDLEYADDIVLLANTKENMQAKIDELSKRAAEFGLRINADKTKSMVIKANPTTFNLDNKPIQFVSDFCYLGSSITTDGGAMNDVLSRIGKARVAYFNLKNIWKSNAISPKTKIHVYNACVKSVLLYGSETWAVNEAIKRKLQTFTNRCLRNILRIWWPRTITNQQLLQLAEQEDINLQIKRRKYCWLGHTLRKPYDEICHATLEWNPQGSRNRGRPKTTWRRTIFTETGKTFSELRYIALDRLRWRFYVNSLCS